MFFWFLDFHANLSEFQRAICATFLVTSPCHSRLLFSSDSKMKATSNKYRPTRICRRRAVCDEILEVQTPIVQGNINT
jgi:hypothetical protein